MIERRYTRILPVALSSDGQANGIVTLPDTCNFRVKMTVILSASGLGAARYQVKRILSSTEMVLGGEKEPLHSRSDISQYTTALSSTIEAPEQERPRLSIVDMEQAMYETEPVVARRVYSVDKWGNPYTEDNPLPTSAIVNLDNINVDISNPTQETIGRITILSDIEKPFTLPDKTVKYQIRSRDRESLFLANVLGETVDTGDNIYINRGFTYVSPDLDIPDGYIIYIKSTKDGTVEIVTWQIL